MANISPGIYTKIIDLSTFVQIVPGTVGFICALTEKGEDNKLKFLGSRNELVDEFGNPDISKYGSQYGQGPYVAYNYLGESSSLYFMRCLPDDAAYSNLRIYGSPLISPITYPYSLDSSANVFIDYASDLNNVTDITTATQIFGNNVPLVVFYAIGRGEYYNDIGITISEDLLQRDQGIYNLDIYETQSDGSYSLIESFKISFNPDEKNQETKESIYVEYILERYSKVLRCKVGYDGFELIEKIYARDVEDINVSSHGATSYIDTTTVEHVEVCTGNSWSTSTGMVTARYFLAGCGTTSDALSIGGGTPGAANNTERWNSNVINYVWMTTTNMNYGRQGPAIGGSTDSALVFGGYSSILIPQTEKWNGSAWTSSSSLNTPRQYLAGCGDTANTLSFGGQISSVKQNITEKWSGSSWATTSALNIARFYLAGCGTTGGALSFGGHIGSSPFYTNITEKWSGSSWATTTVLNQARHGLAGCGTINNALSFGGYTSAVIETTEKWNGSTWATTTNINQARRLHAGCGTTSSSFLFGGGATATFKSEIWNGSSWTTTSSALRLVESIGGCGVLNSSLGVGGSYFNYTDKFILYTGAWTTTSALNQARLDLSACGNTSDALSFGGYTGSYVKMSTTEKWSGSSWATTSALNIARYGLSGCGNTSDALSFGGATTTIISPSVVSTTEKWSGSSWATTSALNIARYGLSGCGTILGALSFGGGTSSSYLNTVEKWSGSSWATTSSLLENKLGVGGCGTVTDALAIGGFKSSGVVAATTEKWNGAIWATISSLNVARYALACCGNTAYALSFGGNTGAGNVNTTEILSSTFITETIIHHHQTIVITDLFQLTDTGQDFTYYETNPETGIALYCVIVKDSFNREIYGWLGSSSNEGNTVNIWKDNRLDTAIRGWLGDVSNFDFDDENMTYRIKRSNLFVPDLFSIRPLKKGKEGSLISQGTFDEDIATEILANGYNGTIDTEVLNIDHMYFNLIFDAGYPKDVKDQIVSLAEVRNDAIAIIDNGDNISVNNSIVTRNNTYNYNTYYASIFEPYSRIFDIFTERHIWFSPCYHLSYILPRNDRLGELWYAAAGTRKGICRDIKELRFYANQDQRDLLYTYQINPIVKQNADYVLWGQLTSQSKTSAMQDLNVVRLVLYVKRALKQYCQNYIFEENSQLLYYAVKNDITSFLEQIKRKRGLYNYTIDIGATDFEIKTKTFHINVILEPLKTTEKVELNFYIK